VKWTKLGRVFCPDGNFPWMRTHAAGPIAEPLEGDLFRVYFGCRDELNRTSVGSLVMDLRQPGRILDLASEPVIQPGPAGTFDDSGTSTGCLVQRGAARYFYYLGWNLGVTVPWRNSIGLAISEAPGSPFRKHSPAPLVDRAATDPFSISYPWVMPDGDGWRMWYGSNLSWGSQAQDMAHVIKYAESDDALQWRREGVIAIGLQSPGEYAIAKPCVVKDAGLYRMWYSHRGPSYRIGYAESADGTAWQRRDAEAGIDVSASGWDSESVQYAFVFRHSGTLYMLYNGNGYGRTGFGLAVASGS
jgi:predicted GH43/DUF377 family glycosyl hydrolase